MSYPIRTALLALSILLGLGSNAWAGNCRIPVKDRVASKKCELKETVVKTAPPSSAPRALAPSPVPALAPAPAVAALVSAMTMTISRSVPLESNLLSSGLPSLVVSACDGIIAIGGVPGINFRSSPTASFRSIIN